MSDTSSRRISPDNLHISSFDLVKDGRDSLLLTRATESYPLSFRRGKLLLPATMLQFGEQPRDAAKRALNAQLSGAESLEPKFVSLQSYMSSHWDIVLVYEFDSKGAREITAKPPYADAAFYKIGSLPRAEIAEDHLEVIDGVVATPSG